MTREEVISVLRGFVASCPLKHDEWQAVEVAIEALKEHKQGEWIDENKGTVFYKSTCSLCGWNSHGVGFNFCPNCGADMSKLQANGDQVKNELNRVSKELNSKTEYKAKVKELENAIAKCEKAEEEFKKRTCKFKSPTNCDFCAFHSECEEHWREGDEK